MSLLGRNLQKVRDYYGQPLITQSKGTALEALAESREGATRAKQPVAEQQGVSAKAPPEATPARRGLQEAFAVGRNAARGALSEAHAAIMQEAPPLPKRRKAKEAER